MNSEQGYPAITASRQTVAKAWFMPLALQQPDAADLRFLQPPFGALERRAKPGSGAAGHQNVSNAGPPRFPQSPVEAEA